MPKKRVLLVTSKYPYSKTESDGGLSTVASVIESIKNEYELDILFIRKFSAEESNIEGVKKIYFEEIEKKSTDKYERRIYNYIQVSNKILEIEHNYSAIIIIHASKAFGLENAPESVLNKVILYPMFLSFSYRDSGEIVPIIYDSLERKCMEKIKWFVCPSNYDKRMILNHYTISQSRFSIIPRSVSHFISHTKRIYTGNNRILSIGNVKVRKQPLLLLKIFYEVKKEITNATLTLAGEIQDMQLYDECLDFIKKNHLEKSVKFVGAVNQEQISQLIKYADLNVCTSNLETFGRCVFEGMYGGLPTIIFDKLTCVTEFVNNHEGIFVVKNVTEFINDILYLLKDKSMYEQQSLKAVKSTDFISFKQEMKKTLELLDYIIRGYDI